MTRSNDSITLITSHEALSISLTTVIDPSLSLWMTFYHFLHYGSRSFAGVLNDALPFPVILNGGKNALWEKQKTEQ